MADIACEEITLGADASCRNAAVTSEKVFQTAFPVFFPRPAKAETESHPVIAWNTRSDFNLSGPRQAKTLCADSGSSTLSQTLARVCLLLCEVPGLPKQQELPHLCPLYE